MSSGKNRFGATKLAQTLALYTAEEWKGLQKWLASPAVNKRGAVQRCYRALLPHFPAFEVTKEGLYQKTFGKRAYDNRTLNNLLSELNRLAEDYLIHLRTLHQPKQRTEQLRRVFAERGALQRHSDLVDKLRPTENLESHPTDEWDYLRRFQRTHDRYFFATEGETYDPEADHLETARRTLEQFYRLASLKLDHELQARAALLREVTNEPPDIAPHPAVELYRLRLERPDLTPTIERTFRNAFYQRYEQLTPTYRRIFAYAALNDLIALDGRGVERLYPEMLELIRRMDRDGLLPVHGYVTGVTLMNVVSITTLCADFEYALDFLDRYAPYLDTTLRPAAYAAARAQIAIERGDADAALDWSQREFPGTARYEFKQRMTRVRALVEIALRDRQPDDLRWEHAAEALRKLTYRTRGPSEEVRRRYRTFTTLTTTLVGAILENAPADQFARIDVLLDQKPTFAKRWLRHVYHRYAPNPLPVEDQRRAG